MAKRQTLKLGPDFLANVQAFLQVKPKAKKKPAKTGRKKMGARKT
jgi:hypothetical protein